MNGKKALELVAKKNGCSVEEVRREIQNAINEGMKSTDPAAVKFWSNLSRNGGVPEPEEVIEAMAKAVRSRTL